jgi:hypothetical protein
MAASPVLAQLSKGRQILTQRGLQTMGLNDPANGFNQANYLAANYSTLDWLWNPNPGGQGAAPGLPWSRWVRDQSEMPGASEQPYLSQLVSLQLSDEQNLNDQGTRDAAVNWFNAVRDQYPNTILYTNSFGGQVGDAELDDFVQRAHPDMLSFDTYPFKSDYGDRSVAQPAYGSPTSWYSELRRYRVHALDNNLPLAVYRQTFHAVQDYDQQVFRDPSPSEQNLNTYGALAFGATVLTDFRYDSGASSMFNGGNQSSPTAFYTQQADLNRRARNLGKALVHLVGINDHPNGADPTTDIMFMRGRTGPNSTDVTPMPIGFATDPEAPNTYSDWVYGRNDPFLSGWGRTNLGTVNEGRVGDVIVSWFKPVDATRDNPSSTFDQVYLMVINALTSATGTAADCRQQIVMDFNKTGINGEVFPGLVQLNSDTGQVEPLTLTSVGGGTKMRLTLTLDGGAGVLLKFNTGNPFVGVQSTGDFNADGKVDGADLLNFQRGVGASVPALGGQGDGNYDLTVNSQDLALWKAQYGGAPAGSVTAAAVPEPAACVLMFAGIGLLFRGKRR